MNEFNQIDILTVTKRIASKKKLFLKVSVITFVVACVVILPVPRFYNSSVVLAPEIGDIMGKNSLMSMAASFGLNMGNSATGDAIYPDLYPELINSNDFVARLVNYKVKTVDGSVDTTYYKYLDKYQKKNPLTAPLRWIGGIKKLFGKEKPSTDNVPLNLFYLNENQAGILGKMKELITCSIDPKTGIITISVQDQDPLIAATIANAVKSELQNAITLYRTNKARNDLEYYQKLTAEAKSKYEKARQLYGSYADANMDVVLESFQSKKTDLENDMQLKYNTYSAMNTQLQSAQAKVQENTPAFTILKEATVPLKPAGPKRMAFVLIMLILSWMVTTVWVSKDLIVELFTKK